VFPVRYIISTAGGLHRLRCYDCPPLPARHPSPYASACMCPSPPTYRTSSPTFTTYHRCYRTYRSSYSIIRFSGITTACFRVFYPFWLILNHPDAWFGSFCSCFMGLRYIVSSPEYTTAYAAMPARPSARTSPTALSPAPFPGYLRHLHTFTTYHAVTARILHFSRLF
jgi:hypothetical protein